MPTDLDIVIAGGGRVGLETAELLANQGHKVTIVERDPAVCDALADEWLATVIEGDATNPDILDQTGIESADAVAALTGETGLNLAVCMAAREMGEDVRTVARIDRAAGEAYTRFVDAVVFPERAGARAAANELHGGDVHTVSELTGSLEIVRVRVAEDAPAAGKTLREVRFPTGTLVITDEDADEVAHPDQELTPGHRYTLAVEPDVTDEVMRLLRG